MAWLPPDISVVFAIILVAASFVTSALTAALGVGGGTALLAVMASGLPVATVIPVHGVVQLGSNAGRAVVHWTRIDWTITLWFCACGVLGAVVGGATVVSLPDAPLKLAVAAFILLMVWGPKPRAFGRSLAAVGAGGALGGLLTMYVGATGPFTAAVLRARGLDRFVQVATFSSCMTLQHLLKIAVFGFLGFAFAEWAVLAGLMIATGFLGTLAGTRLLHALPEKGFTLGLNIVLTAMALQMGVAALLAW